MDEKRSLFKVIFWIVTGIILFCITGVISIFALNLQIMPEDVMPLRIFGVVAMAIMSIPILVGVLVFKDAKRLNLNEWMWLLIVMYTPNLIGLIVYLIVRSNEKNKARCNKCGERIEMDFAVCPNCGNGLKEKCAGCGKYVDKEWKTCPYCEKKLDN